MSEQRLILYHGGSLVRLVEVATAASDSPLTPDERLILELDDERAELRRQRDEAVKLLEEARAIIKGEQK